MSVTNRLLIFFAFLLMHPAVAQVRIAGVLLEEENEVPIAFANIGILNTSIGTISNPDGTFELIIPRKHLKDSVLFSALGYQRKSFLLQELAEQGKLIIVLREQSTMLENVIVKSRQRLAAGTLEFGNRHTNARSVYADSIAGGAAMALLVENRYPNYHPEFRLPVVPLKARLKISYNTFDTFRVRLRFLSVDSITGLPDKDLYDGSIIVTSGIHQGWLTFDLQRYQIKINRPAFFIVFEWLMDKKDRVELLEQYQEFKRQYPGKVVTDTLTLDGERTSFSTWYGYRAGTLFATSSDKSVVNSFRCYYRNNSYGRWRRASAVLTSTLTVQVYR